MNLPVQDISVEESRVTKDVYLFPAGMEQHRYWILDQVDRASTASNMAITWSLVGPVDNILVEKSICALSLRHEALRTTFRMIDGDLNQVISEEPLYHFSVTDLKSLPKEDRITRAEGLIREHSHVAMDLATGPLFFVQLIHVTDQEHFLVCTMHHIVCDGWSNGVLIRDFAEFYSAYSQDRSPDLPELPFQFADFTIWQKEWLTTDAAKDALNFWREQIQAGSSAVDLPTDYSRTARKDGPGHIESQLMPQTLNESLKQFCRQHEATNHQVLLAVFQGLIARYTSQDKFLLGSSIANRTQSGMDDIVGRFANPQVILADVTGNPSFEELLNRVTKWSTLAYAHQDLPFSQLMEEFHLDQSGATSQFLQIYFVYQKAFMQPQHAGELQIVPRPSVSGGVNFDMLVSIVERAEGSRLQIEYNTDLFRKERIQQLIQQYIRVLTAVLDDPAKRVSQLPLLTAEEELSLHRIGQSAPLSRAMPASLIEAFDHHATQLKTTTAIIAGNERVSWKELADRSIQFAHGLLQLNITSGQLIAIRMEANADAAAAALAVLRAGGIVLPIPASTSIGEWNRILTEIQPSLIISSAEFSKHLSSAVSFDTLRREVQKEVILPSTTVKCSAWSALSINSADRYQIHTFSHEAGMANLTAAAQVLCLTSCDMVAVKSSPVSIDAWIDLMLPLTSGASILYLDEIPADQLQITFDREQAGFGLATSSEWIDFLNSGWPGDRRLQMICRGDRLSQATRGQLLSAGHIWSLVSSASAGGPISLVSIDKESAVTNPAAPLPGNSFTILDAWNNPVPEGVLGELALSHNSMFVRTGLLAQYDLNHGFTVVDRTQGLVFLHRSRLKLAELEDRLLAIPGVMRAKAIIGSDQTLSACVSGANGALALTDVIQSLRATAPGYLSCADLLSIERIILRPDGSLDTEAVYESNTLSIARRKSEDYVPPRDEIESKLVAIWEDVIGVKGIGVRTSFFLLGGYSMMIVRLFARINKIMNTSLPLTTIFNAPTIEQLADLLRGRKAYSSIVPVRTEGSKPPFFMILSYLLYGSLPDALGKDLPFYGLRELDDEEHMTPEERAASYVKAIRSVQPEGPYYIGGWCAAGPLTIEVGRQLTECGQQVGLVTLFDSWHPGYAEKLKQEHKAAENVTAYTKLRHRYFFHKSKFNELNTASRLKYLKISTINKLRSVRDSIYLRHYAVTKNAFKFLGLPMPDFMYNLTKTTLMSLQEYQPRPFSGNLLLIRAINAPSLPGSDPTCGWNQVVRGDIDVAWVRGDHETMFIGANLESVGEILRNGLEKAYQARQFSALA
jgi:non-ribosomal peptide synthetase component F/thioesterase domain-containing protein